MTIMTATSSTERGTVKWLSIDKGFGFIVDIANRDRYFRVTDVIGKKLPIAGQDVTFVPLENKRGYSATQISLLGHATATAGNGRVHCVSCNNHVFPRLVTYRGVPDNSFCPVCGSLIFCFNDYDASRPGRELWMLMVTCTTHISTQIKKLFSKFKS
jgi:cold shock CspA family protein